MLLLSTEFRGAGTFLVIMICCLFWIFLPLFNLPSCLYFQNLDQFKGIRLGCWTEEKEVVWGETQRPGGVAVLTREGSGHQVAGPGLVGFGGRPGHDSGPRVTYLGKEAAEPRLKHGAFTVAVTRCGLKAARFPHFLTSS